MIKNIFILIVFFYILVLFQASFLVHFNILGIIPNFILILVIVINLLEKAKNYAGYFSAVIGGFFLDVFSSNFIGFWILILLAITVFIKFIFKKYIRLPKFVNLT